MKCPCCMGCFRGDVWYDCKCFNGGKKSCKTCTLPQSMTPAVTGKHGLFFTGPRVEKIAANLRGLGWDKDPSPGMRDYLTPGWR